MANVKLKVAILQKKLETGKKGLFNGLVKYRIILKIRE